MATNLFTRSLAAIVMVSALVTSAHAITIDWATIGDIGNADDTHGDGYGGVGYEYRISKHEVTNTQYVEFLNAVASTDTFALYNTSMGISTWGGITRSGSSGSYSYSVKSDAVGQGPGGSDYAYADKPVVWVSWYDTVRFSNWLTSGTTESGTYTITGGGVNSGSVVIPDHSALAAGKIFLPTEDEWYKAAYFDGSTYFDYAAGSDSTPNNNLPSADTGNSANFFDIDHGYTTGDNSYSTTDVGDYGLSASPYGTFDQGGNVWEWNETPISSGRGLRGGSWGNITDNLTASNRDSGDPTAEVGRAGFRIASSAVCAVGDADCDGDVDISGDILPAFSNFSGPGSTNRTRAQGDVEGNPDGNQPTTPHPADGDVDVSDLLTMFGNFTGPLDEAGGLVAAEAADPNIPDLIYDPATGEVVLDVDGSGIIGYVLKNGDSSFAFGNHLQILAGVKTSVAGELSEAAFATSVGANSIGNVFPLGMNLAALTAYLTVNDVSRSLGAPVVPFDLIVIGPAVPEPSTYALAAIGLLALGFYGWRRKRA